jgi:hypothetical protein
MFFRSLLNDPTGAEFIFYSVRGLGTKCSIIRTHFSRKVVHGTSLISSRRLVLSPVRKSIPKNMEILTSEWLGAYLVRRREITIFVKTCVRKWTFLGHTSVGHIRFHGYILYELFLYGFVENRKANLLKKELDR